MIVIGGATACGKTAFAALLAKKLNTAIISADSMQIYRGMDIGTAKERDEKLGVRQYCVDIAEPTENFSVVEYKNHAEKALSLFGADIPIVAGGTGYYIDSLIYSLNYGHHSDTEIRKRLENRYNSEGIDGLYGDLKKYDPVSAEKIHKNNARKVIRALEVTLASGIPFSSQNTETKILRPHKIYILYQPERGKMYEKINLRVEKMLADGLEKEVFGLLSAGVSFEMQSMQGIGYKEWKGYFEKTASLSETAELIKLNTRHYAKRQETWFRSGGRYSDAVFIESNALNFDKITDSIANDMILLSKSN